MTIEEILLIEKLDDRIKALQVANADIKIDYETSSKQYDPLKHDVMDPAIREPKKVLKPTGEVDGNGKDRTETSIVEPARIAVPFQRILVNRTTSFLLNNGIDIQTDAEVDKEISFLELIKKIWGDNKLDYKTKQLARLWMSECEVAELWYFTKEETGFWGKLLVKLGIKSTVMRARVKIIARSLGDTPFPHFDESGNMDAFSRGYFSLDEAGKKVEKFEVYTNDKIYHYTKTDNGWIDDEGYPKANEVKKIPAIYYSRPFVLWYDVQKLIDRYETLLSNFADSNDYFGSPMIKVKGTVVGFANKGEQGKILEMTGEGADANYLTWDQAPESIKLELETLQNLIYSLTQVPDISFTQMSKLGNMSGISRKLMFLDMHLKCFNEIEIFGEMIQRRLNLMKSMVGNVIATSFSNEAESIELWPEFTPYLPSADEEMITSLSTAAGGKPIMSQETATKLNPYVKDADAEIKKIREEESMMNQEAVI